MKHGANKAIRVIFIKYIIKISNHMLYMSLIYGTRYVEDPTSAKNVESARSICSNIAPYHNKHDI